MTSVSKPVPCGCGGEAMLYVSWNYYCVICKKCGISTDNYGSETEAVCAWNRAMLGNHECSEVKDCEDER